MTTKYSIVDVWNDLSELQATCFTKKENDIVIRRIMKKIEKSKMWNESEKTEIIILEVKRQIDSAIKDLQELYQCLERK